MAIRMVGDGFDGRNLPEERHFWTAYDAGIISLLLVESIAAFIQCINLWDDEQVRGYSEVLGSPASGISLRCSCSSGCSLFNYGQHYGLSNCCRIRILWMAQALG
jgi:hypothetical protein